MPPGPRSRHARRLVFATCLPVVLVACGGEVVPSPSPPAADHGAFTIAFGGDVNLGRRQNAISARDGAERALEGVPAVGDADLAIVNLESVVSSIGEAGVHKGERAPFYFRGRPETLNVLVAAGVDAVATANNHSGDYGPDALLDQERLLDASGVGHAGSGPDLTAACAAELLPAGELVVALVSVDATMPFFEATATDAGTCHVPLDQPDAWRERIGPVLESARSVAHLVLVAVHWGPNDATEPSPEKRAVGRLLVELGADAVLGSSAHVLQGIEIVDGRPIIHDAGNLLFDSQEGEVDSALFVLEVEARGVVGVRVEPLISGYGITSRAERDEAARILEGLAAQSDALGTALANGRLSLDPPPREPPPALGHVPLRELTAAEPAAVPPPSCVVDAPADGLAGGPQQLGPLTFLGARVEPSPVEAGRLAWVESYWRVESTPADAVWLSPRLESTGGGEAWRYDHQPCDWGWPASRLEPGLVYRDRAPIRPRDAPGDELVLRMALTDGDEEIAITAELARIVVDAE